MGLAIINKLNIKIKVVNEINYQYIIISNSELSKEKDLIRDNMHPSMVYIIDL